MGTYKVMCKRYAYVEVTVDADNAKEAVQFAITKAHEKVGLLDYEYWGDFVADKPERVCRFCVNDLVRWNDPAIYEIPKEERKEYRERIFVVDETHNNECILLHDAYGTELEAPEWELTLVKKEKDRERDLLGNYKESFN